MAIDPEALVGSTSPAPLQAVMLDLSEKSWSYFWGRPYPRYAFGPQQWPPERGPIPTALPYAQVLITEGAEFTFRNGTPAFSVPQEQAEGLKSADELLQRIIRQNCLAEQWVSLAESAGNQGALAVKFSVDQDDLERPIRINFLDVPQECRLWFDPHDCNRLLLARIQYPYRDARTGEWFYFREEWTDDLWVSYRPRYAGPREVTGPQSLPGYTVHLGDDDAWEFDQIQDNPFGVIPVGVIRNRRSKGNPLGVGDCWDVFPLIDRIALAMHREDRASQLHSEPQLAVLNAELDQNGPMLPGEPLNLYSDRPNAPPADAKLLEPSGSAREYSHRTIDRWEDLLYKRVGISRVSTEAVTNKGNMTALAFAMTFARTIATSDRKRELWGNSGMVPFFRRLLLGLSRMGGFKELARFTDETTVSAEWPPYFQVTDDDRQAITDRTVTQVQSGLLTVERGAERVARAENVPANEIEDLKKELAAQAAEQKRAEAAALKDQGAGGGDPAAETTDGE